MTGTSTDLIETSNDLYEYLILNLCTLKGVRSTSRAIMDIPTHDGPGPKDYLRNIKAKDLRKRNTEIHANAFLPIKMETVLSFDFGTPFTESMRIFNLIQSKSSGEESIKIATVVLDEVLPVKFDFEWPVTDGTIRVSITGDNIGFRADPVTTSICPERVETETKGIENPHHYVLDFSAIDEQIGKTTKDPDIVASLRKTARQKLSVYLKTKAKIVYSS